MNDSADQKSDLSSSEEQIKLTRTDRPMHVSLAEYLRKQILQGILAPGSPIESESALCSKHDISRTPVRQALAELAREGLIRRIPGKGTFVTDVFNQSPEKNQSNKGLICIGILIDAQGPETLQNFVVAETISGLSNTASTLSDRCKTVFQFHRFVGSNDPIGRSFLAREEYDGMIALPYSAEAVNFFANVKQVMKPMITLYRKIQNPWVCSFHIENEKGAYQATDYLIRLGHQRIGFIEANFGSAAISGADRYKGYCAALENAGIRLDPSIVGECQNSQFTTIVSITKAVLSQKPAPTALIIGGVLFTEACLYAIDQMELKIPDDISVLAFDESATTRSHEPPLSVVHMPLELVAETALKRILSIIEGQPVNKSPRSFYPELIIRQSCASPQKKVEAPGTVE